MCWGLKYDNKPSSWIRRKPSPWRQKEEGLAWALKERKPSPQDKDMKAQDGPLRKWRIKSKEAWERKDLGSDRTWILQSQEVDPQGRLEDAEWDMDSSGGGLGTRHDYFEKE